MMPTPPFRLRNRLAETILTALTDPRARRELQTQDFAWLGEASDEQAALVSARARRASEALAACPTLNTPPSLGETLAAAAALFDAGLFFEVHELLEPHWVSASGPERQALQGLIQVAVAFQHLANGNLEGARSLMVEGSARLKDGWLPGSDLESFAESTSAAATRLGGPMTIPPFPRWT